MSRARDDEMTFVLLGRDAAAPFTIRQWIQRRIALGKNQHGDPQIVEALACAATMENGTISRMAESLVIYPDPVLDWLDKGPTDEKFNAIAFELAASTIRRLEAMYVELNGRYVELLGRWEAKP